MKVESTVHIEALETREKVLGTKPPARHPHVNSDVGIWIVSACIETGEAHMIHFFEKGCQSEAFVEESLADILIRSIPRLSQPFRVSQE